MFELQAPMQTLIDTAVLRLKADLPDAGIALSFSDFPHPDSHERWDVFRDYGATFVYISLMFTFVVQVRIFILEGGFFRNQ
jgi:hypothetical protein